MNKAEIHSQSTRQHGFSLLDALIAIVVFSFGLLALAALQTVTKQSNYEAIQRTTASMLAHDLMERMRMNSLQDPVNKSGLYYYFLNGGAVENPSVLKWNEPETLTAPNPNCNTGTCITSAQQAAWDLYEFQQLLRGANEKSGANDVGGLLNPTVCISTTGTSGASGPYTITIVWRGQAAIPLAAAPANTCGAALYDKVSGDYAYRRILEIEAFMSCPNPGGCV